MHVCWGRALNCAPWSLADRKDLSRRSESLFPPPLHGGHDAHVCWGLALSRALVWSQMSFLPNQRKFAPTGIRTWVFA
jgi:hypothetical protein